MAVKTRFAVGLDVGSAWVRCVVGVIDNRRLRFIGAGLAESRGWLRGRIVDLDAAASSIRAAVREAEMQAHLSIETAVIGMGGQGIEGLNSRSTYSFGKAREILPEDLKYAVELASRLTLPIDRLILQVCPQEFTVDGHGGHRNPRGLTCSRLEANAHLITGLVHEHQSLVSALHMAHLAVEETVYEPLAAAYVSLLPHDRNRGVALIDLGIHSTDMVVYDGDALMHTVSLPIWADHFTNDVAKVMTLSYESAEQLKCEFGCALLGMTADNTYVEIQSADGKPDREVPRRLLNEILEARAEELFGLIKYELRRAGMSDKLVEGVVLTGGGSDLQGMLPAAERVLNVRARAAQPIGIEQWPEHLAEGKWTTAAGLCMYSARLKVRNDRPGRGFNIFGFGER